MVTWSADPDSHGTSQSSRTPLPGDPIPPPGVASTRHAKLEQTYMQALCICSTNNKSNYGASLPVLKSKLLQCPYCVRYGEETGSFVFKSSFSTGPLRHSVTP